MEESNIPREFRLADEEYALHKNCRVCDKELLNNGEAYCIEKVVRQPGGDNPPQEIFHFAICINCLEQLRKRMSQESLTALENFQRQRLEQLQQENRLNLLQSFNDKTCLFTGRPVNELESYQMIAFCRGRNLAPFQPPMIIGSEILEESSQLLSAKTRDELEDFTNNNFGWPPEFARLLKSGEVGIF